MDVGRTGMGWATVLAAGLLLAGCWRGTGTPKASAPRKEYEHRFPEWTGYGVPSEFSLGCRDWFDADPPPTQDEAVRLAQDVAAIFLDTRLGSWADALEPQCKTLSDGWEITLRLKQEIGGEVLIRLWDMGWVREMHVVSAPRDGYWWGSPLTSHQEAANRETAARLGGGERMVAALTALDCCRILASHVDRLYIRDIHQNELGDWEVQVGERLSNADCENMTWSLRLRKDRMTLDRFEMHPYLL